MPEEFAVYGLSRGFCYLIGAVKLSVAALLIVSLIEPGLGLYASGLLAVLMFGAVVMHFKVGDPVRRAVPAAALLLTSVFLVWRCSAM
jgi:uncharacterized membrane protein YkgB